MLTRAVFFFLLVFTASCVNYSSYDLSLKSEDLPGTISDGNRIYFVSDLCLLYDEHFVLDKVTGVENEMNKLVKAVLSAKGFNVSYDSLGYYCGAVEPDYQHVKYQDNVASDVQIRYLPIYSDAYHDKKYDVFRMKNIFRNTKNIVVAKETEYLKKIKSAAGSGANRKGDQNPAKQIKPAFSYSGEKVYDIADMFSDANADMALLLLSQGSYVPWGSAVGGFIMTGALSPSVSNDDLSYKQEMNSKVEIMAALFDIKTGKILWSNSIKRTGMDPTDANAYKLQWMGDLFVNLPNVNEDSATGK